MARVKERRTKLKTMVGYMDVREIAERLDVDRSTIYNDLRSLVKERVTCGVEGRLSPLSTGLTELRG